MGLGFEPREEFGVGIRRQRLWKHFCPWLRGVQKAWIRRVVYIGLLWICAEALLSFNRCQSDKRADVQVCFSVIDVVHTEYKISDCHSLVFFHSAPSSLSPEPPTTSVETVVAHQPHDS